jgi:cysteine desulfurase
VTPAGTTDPGAGERTWAYLDHAATTPMRPEAIEAMLPVLTERFGNPSGAHALGRDARDALEEAREQLAEVAGRAPGELVLTGGGTEADNLAVRGVLGARGGTVVCTAIEHHAVLHPVEHLGGRIVPVLPTGRVDLDALAGALGPDVTLVSVGLVNNEVGVVQDLHAVAEVVHRHAPEALLHTDAAQALCWVDVAVAAAPADLVALAAHKCGGPKGIGALVVRDGVALEPLLLGGGQERDRRSGTQDVAGAVAFAAAARAVAAERPDLVERCRTWRDRLVDAVLERVPGAHDTAGALTGGDRSHVAPGWAHVCLPEVSSEALLFALEHDHGVLASAASSCASGAQEASHVLSAMGVPDRVALGALRLTLGWSTTEGDVERAIEAVVAAVDRLRPHARPGSPA